MTDTENNKQKTEKILVFAYQKAERIATAIYVVTDLMHEHEPLRSKLRHKALALLGGLLPLKDKSLLSMVHREIIPTVSEILSLLAVGRTARLLSEMNVALLESELIKLSAVLEETHGHTGEVSLDASFFDFEDYQTQTHALLPEAMKRLRTAEGYKGQKSIKDKRTGSGLSGSGKAFGKTSGKDASGRKEQILKALKGRGEVTVGDVAKEVGEYSEKTIQRDLAGLVNLGVVVREGARRWTRYRLV